MEEQEIRIKFDFQAFSDCFYMQGPFGAMVDELFELVKEHGLTDSSHIHSIDIVLNDVGYDDELVILFSTVRGINYWYKSKLMINDKLTETITYNEDCKKEEEPTKSSDAYSKLKADVDRAINSNNYDLAERLLELMETYQRVHLLI